MTMTNTERKDITVSSIGLLLLMTLTLLLMMYAKLTMYTGIHSSMKSLIETEIALPLHLQYYNTYMRLQEEKKEGDSIITISNGIRWQTNKRWCQQFRTERKWIFIYIIQGTRRTEEQEQKQTSKDKFKVLQFCCWYRRRYDRQT